MNEIKVYRSLWRTAITIIGCLAFAALGVFLLLNGGRPELCWLSIVFFGLGGLFMLYVVIKEKITHQPYLIITDEYVQMNSGKSWVVQYADVDFFSMMKSGYGKMIGINYKKEVESRKMGEAKEIGRAVRRMNANMAGSAEAIPVFDLTVKPGTILEILNERLTAYREKSIL